MRTDETRQTITRPEATAKVLAGVLLMALVGATPAYAQSIDYSALEQLFGEPVTMSVTGSPQRQSEVPAAMTIITADEIRRSGARDIPGVLRHVAGVDVLQWGNDNADVAVRGYNQAQSPRLLVLIDGRQVYADFFGYTPWATLPVQLAGIRQIEVVKGPNSALFGFNAVGGVINIITWHPLYDDVDTVTVRGGTQNLAEGSLVATRKFGDAIGLKVTLGAGTNDDFSTPQRPIDANSRRGNELYSASFNGVFRPRQGMEASLEATFTDSAFPQYIATYSGGYATYQTRSLQGLLAAETGIGLVQGRVYSNHLEFLFDGGANAGVNTVLINKADVVQLQDIFKLGTRHTLRAAIEYRHYSASTVPVPGAEVFYEVLAASGMWEWKIAPSLVLTNAGRVDRLSLGRSGVTPPGYPSNGEWNSQSSAEVSFNSGLVWDADSFGAFRATLARGVQQPNLEALGALFIATPFGHIGGNPFVEPTIVTHYELGWDQALSAAKGSIEVSAFLDETEAIAAFDFLSFGANNLATNIGDSEAYGLEVSLKGEWGAGWRGGLSYTPEIVHDHFAPGFTVQSTLTDFEHTYPKHVVNGNLGWASGAWEVDGYFRYESEFQGIQGDDLNIQNNALVRIPDYFSVDARIAYQVFAKAVLALSGQNLLNDEQRQTSAADIERRVFATLSITF